MGTACGVTVHGLNAFCAMFAFPKLLCSVNSNACIVICKKPASETLFNNKGDGFFNNAVM